MKTKKKVRIVKSDSVNYTFIDDVVPKISKKQKESYAKKKAKLVRYTLKDTKTKTYYKSSSNSPKSQQNHSPVYE